MTTETRTTSMLLRVSLILAVTATAYGLQTGECRQPRGSECPRHRRSKAEASKKMAQV